MRAEPKRATPEAGLERGPRRLDPLLRPRSVVVVGASPNPSFVSGIFKNLLRHGFTGSVAAVNPRYDRVNDAPCYPSVRDVPWPIDLAVVGIAWRLLPALLEECQDKQVGALEIITSGFAEAGGEGIERQARLAAWAQRTGTAVGGPNCLGLMHAPTGMMALPSTFSEVVAGHVGLVLQSGMMAPSVLTPLFARGIGVTWAATSGNEADVDLAEYISYFVDDEQTHVIGCFAEQIKRPAAFLDACELAAAAGKPIVMLKIGRSDAARRAALGHTGSLVGADGVIDAVLRKSGVTRVASVDEMFEALAVFHCRRLPRGTGLAAISVSGGAAGLMSDLAADGGVQFARLTDNTQAQLRAVVPEFGNVGNPLDVTGQGVFQPDLLERSLDLLAADPGVDAIVYARSFPSRFDGLAPAYQALQRSIATNPQIPFLAMSLAGGHFFPAPTTDTPVQEPRDRLDDVPFLQGAEYGLKAVGALMRYASFQRSRQVVAPSPRLDPGVRGGARAILQRARGPRLSAAEGSALLAMYGIAAPREFLARTCQEAVAAASQLGYPVAAKVEAPSLRHKARAGGVVLSLGDAAAVETAFDRLRELAPDVQGVLIQEMMEAGRVEIIAGMSRDPQFGAVIACGLGGVFVETLRDVQLLLPPLTAGEVRAALGRLRGAAALDGADVDALVEILARFSQLCRDIEDLVQEIDLNPVLVRAAGQGACTVDSLFILND